MRAHRAARMMVLGTLGVGVAAAVVLACSDDKSDTPPGFETGGHTSGTEGGSVAADSRAPTSSGLEFVSADIDGKPLRFDQNVSARLHLNELGISGDKPDASRYMVLFRSTDAGVRNCASGNALMLYIQDQIVGYGVQSPMTCTITITSTGKVGDRIQGTFSGTLTNKFPDAGGPPTVSVTNGAFDVVRGPDEP